jgi:hypothetical protein
MSKKTKKILLHEKLMLDNITELHTNFMKLERTHPDEAREWINAIHQLQNVIGWRILRRDYPGIFYSIQSNGTL